jgi:UDP-glucose 4-epimerase
MNLQSFQDNKSLLNERMQMNIEKFYQGKKVLVTGGCGFIGSHLAEKLVALGAQVTIMDDLSTGFAKNIETIKDRVTFLRASIVDQAACEQAVAGNQLIFHLAACTSVPGSVADPVTCHKINVDGMFNLLNAARNHNIERFIFSSTSAIYGPRETACIESDHRNPISPYGATKLMGELYCTQFMLNFNLPCVMLRYFNVYGSRQNPNSQYAAAVAKFLQQLEANKPITIFGDGLQTRDFVSVDRVVEANLIVGMAPIEKVNGQVFNVATGSSISILSLAQKLKEQYPAYKEEILFLPARSGDVKHTMASVMKFNSLTQEMAG